MLVVGRARPGVSYNKNYRVSRKCSQSVEVECATKRNSPTKRQCLNPICCSTHESPDRMPKPNADAMPAQAFVNVERKFVALLSSTRFRSRFRINVACDECRGSSSLWFQRTSGLAANLRSRPFRRSFDMASWWVVGSHTNAHSGNTSTKRSASCRRGPLIRP